MVSISSAIDIVKHMLPSGFNCAERVVSHCKESGLFAELKEIFRLDRCKGSQGIDLFVFVVTFFAVGQLRGGFRKFADTKRVEGGKIAAVGGRDGMMSQAAVSRALSAVNMPLARKLSSVLTASLARPELFAHPAVQNMDALGEPWHVFDFDPTVSAYRQRALPQGEGLPEAKRLSTELASPGTAGRKRGKVVMRRCTLQHRGTRFWWLTDLCPGPGDWRDQLENAHHELDRIAELNGVDRARTILVTDGETHGTPQVQIGRQFKGKFLTRRSFYKPLKDDDVRLELEARTWSSVRDSGSGPKRQATEFGELDGIRLVVSRRQASKKSGAGIVFDGHLYEVFATNLDERTWPAAELVTLYYERAGIENYFLLEDRERALDHLYSKNLAGMWVVCAVALWLWNLEVLLGIEAHGGLEPLAETERVALESGKATEAQDLSAMSMQVPVSEVDPSEAGRVLNARFDHGVQIRSGGFRWDAVRQTIVCPADKAMRFIDTRPKPSDKTEVRYRAEIDDCRHCPLRAGCTRSQKSGFQKEIAITIAHAPRQTAWHLPAAPPQPGQFRPVSPRLAPQVLRTAFRRHAEADVVLVLVHRAPREPQPSYYHANEEARQRRRQTWARRLEYKALQPADVVTVLRGDRNEARFQGAAC
jgi:hypothetical protein